jgi:CheY-like chemotaxis protein
VERVLSGAGYRVLVAANGRRALEISRAQAHIDLLFTDMVMPGMSGPDLAERLTATHPEVRVLYASGYTDDAIVRGDGAGASVPYVPKPFAAEVLLSRVREVLDGPRITPPAGRSSDPTR